MIRNLILITLLLTHGSYAQQLHWAGQIEGTYHSPVHAMCEDPSGNLWATGFYQGDTDFDLGPGINQLPGAPAELYIHVAKYDTDGTILWAGRFGSGYVTVAYGTNIQADGNGNIYVAGQFTGASDFDPGPGEFILDDVDIDGGGHTDVFAMKLDPLGDLLWAIQLGDSASDYCRDMVLDDAGNVILAINLADTVDIDPGPGIHILPVSSQTAVLVKLGPDGSLLWYHVLGQGEDWPWISLGTNMNNDIWVATNNYIRKFNSFGTLLLEAPLAVITADLTGDSSGNVYLTGSFQGTVDMDPGPGVSNITASGSYDLFCAKLGPLGDLLWAIRLGGTGQTFGSGIEQASNGDIYLTGGYETGLDLDPGPGTWPVTNAGDQDALVVQIDSSGAFLEAMTLTGTGDQIIYGSVSIGISEWVVYGAFEDIIDVDPGTSINNLTCTTFSDGLIAKYGSSSTSTGEDLFHDRLQISPNPSSGWVQVSNIPSEMHTMVVFDAVGVEVLRLTSLYMASVIQIDLSDLSEGLYWIKVVTPKTTISAPVLLTSR